MQNHPNQLLSDYAPEAGETTNTETELDVPKSEKHNSLRHVEDSGHLLLPRIDTKKGPKSKEVMEMLAQNRGNAMLRYKEKKKTRRQWFHSLKPLPQVVEVQNFTHSINIFINGYDFIVYFVLS
ncbi:hypothetical protein TorRG33x02_089650 [Trema orientale]|uniref:Uncharacterized protein n=1 Tax=Trema orientale TaxID=63057 RepID=A0A2P5FCD5_TREOI|nr:hypothetical protein TorRG33x02_089650 [Trema orientale]